MIDNSKFESQSETIIEKLVNDRRITREEAIKTWFNSKTYNEIVKKKITYISAMRAYIELELEESNDPDWMRNSFE